MSIKNTLSKFRIPKSELIQILIAWLGITFAFSWKGFNFSLMLHYLPMILVGTLTGFIVHELAHKFTAMHYGAFAEFVMWPAGLIAAIVLSFVTNGMFVFAAPGAVYISGTHITRRQNGIISIAGPLSNLILALVFILLVAIIPVAAIKSIFFGAAYINIFLGLFNMLPIPPLDGYKVLSWNPIAWGSLGGILIALFFML